MGCVRAGLPGGHSLLGQEGGVEHALRELARSPFLPGDLFLLGQDLRAPPASCLLAPGGHELLASPLPPWAASRRGTANRDAPSRVLQPDPGGGLTAGAGQRRPGRAGRVKFQS